MPRESRASRVWVLWRISVVTRARFSYLRSSDAMPPPSPSGPETYLDRVVGPAMAAEPFLRRVGPSPSESGGVLTRTLDFGESPVTWNYRWIGAVAVALSLAGSPAKAQFYGGGYWGAGYAGGQTIQGSALQGAGAYAMGVGRYNVETAQARSINADTAMRWNQYM